ncbi:hypothetical protein ABFS83_06G102600 [Erythranthe nasuta]
MECNRDEAMRAKSIAEAKLEQRDFLSAKKFALKAQNLYPGLDGISPLLMTLDVYISAENKINGETDWYGVLAVSPSADENMIKKQFRRLALLLHPDKNSSIGADGAFKLISEAWKLLLDGEKRLAYNQRRGIIGFQQRIPAHTGGAPSAHTGCAPSAPCTSGAPSAHAGCAPSTPRTSGAPSAHTGGAPSAPRTSGAPSSHTGGAPSAYTGFRPQVYTGASPSAYTGGHPPAQPGVGPSARTAGRPPAHTSVPPAYTSGPSAYPSGSSAPPGARTAVPKAQKKSAKVPSRPAPTPLYKKNGDTFWTICNLCNMQYEYLRMYLNNILRCPSCKKPFMALEMAQPRFSKKCKPVPYQAKKKPSENSTTQNAEDPAPSVASRGPTFVVISQLPRDKKTRNRQAPTSDPCPKKAKVDVASDSSGMNSNMAQGSASVSGPKIYDFSGMNRDIPQGFGGFATTAGTGATTYGFPGINHNAAYGFGSFGATSGSGSKT